MQSKTFEFHIFLTSAPKGAQPVQVVVDDEVGFWGPPREASKLDKLRANWNEISTHLTFPAKLRLEKHFDVFVRMTSNDICLDVNI